MNEIVKIWQSLLEFEDLYEISNFGNCRRKMSGEHLTHIFSQAGYPQYCLRKNGKPFVKFVHRLVAIQFIHNPNGYKLVNHIDGNITHFHYTNLEWCTHSENAIHGRSADKYSIRTLTKSINNTMKAKQLTFRPSKENPKILDDLLELAKKDHRPLNNYIEMILVEHLNAKKKESN